MDRSVNISTDSRFSVKTTASQAARLDETLTSVWGKPSSSQQTPLANPRGEAASYFEMASRSIAEQLGKMLDLVGGSPWARMTEPCGGEIEVSMTAPVRQKEAIG